MRLKTQRIPNEMDIYLPIAEVSANIFFLIAVGIMTGLIGGLFGVGGSFIGIPILASYGIESSVAIASYTHQMIAISFMSIPEDSAQKKIDMKLAFITFIGGSTGSVAGSFLFKYLTFNGQIEFVIAFIYIFILGGISIFTIMEGSDSIIKKYFPNSRYALRATEIKLSKKDGFLVRAIDSLPNKIQVSETKQISIFLIIFFGLSAGLLVALGGISSGFIMIPIMIYIYKMNIRRAIATSNVHGGFLVILSTIVQTLNSHTVDLILSVILAFSTAFGLYFSRKFASKIPAEGLRVSLGIIMFILIGRIVANIIFEPTTIFSLSLIR